MTSRNIFKCKCGNHEFFISGHKCQFGDTLDTNCIYCNKRKTLKFVKCEAI